MADTKGLTGRELRRNGFAGMPSAVLQADVSPGAKVVLVGIADYLKDDQWEAWPSHKQIAGKCGMSERQARTYRKELREAKLLCWRRRFQTTNVYHFPRDNPLYGAENPERQDATGFDSEGQGQAIGEAAMKGATMPESTCDRWLTAAQVGKRLGIGSSTVRLWVGKKIIPAVRINAKTLRFDPAAVDAALRERSVGWRGRGPAAGSTGAGGRG